MKEKSELRKDVFAWFGSAVYAAQCFEVELCTLMLIINRLKIPDVSQEELNEIYFKLERKTIGQLLKELSTHLDIDPEFQILLNDYLTKRNYLMHRFFYENAANLLSQEGCERIIEELKEIYSLLMEADEMAKTMSTNVRGYLGISEEKLQEIVQANLKKLLI